MNDEELEARLARWQPADAPPDLLRRLRAVKPPERATRWSWPLAYAGLSVAWTFIFTLWLATPSQTMPTAGASVAQADAGPSDTPAFVNSLAMERAFFFSRSNPDQL